jgi:hypothetical protein
MPFLLTMTVDAFTASVWAGNALNSEPECTGEPLQALTPPESLLPAHASPGAYNELTQSIKRLKEEVAGLKRKIESLGGTGWLVLE